MSTLLDFLRVPVRMEDISRDRKFDLNAEPPWGARELDWHSPVYGIDEFHEYVTFNMFNELYPGSSITINTTDEYEHWLTPLYEGYYSTDVKAFDFGDSDFTIETQFGIGGTYYYNELEDRSWIPLFGLGTDTSIEDANVLFYMTNPGNPNYVQQGYLSFYVKDTAGVTVDISIGSPDWYFSTYPGYMHAEFSRCGQVFTFKLLSRYGQKIVSFTSAPFGSIDISNFTRFYIGTLPTYGSIANAFRGIKVTKGFCRNTSSICAGTYAAWHRKSKSRIPLRKQAHEYCLRQLLNPIVGLVQKNVCSGYIVIAGANFSVLGVAVTEVVCVGSVLLSAETIVSVSGVGIVGYVETSAPYDFDAITKYLDYDFGNPASLTMSGSRIAAVSDQSGNSRNAAGVNGGPVIAYAAINGLAATGPDTYGYLSLGTHVNALLATAIPFYLVLVCREVYSGSLGYKPIFLQQSTAGSGGMYFGVYDYVSSASLNKNSYIYNGANWNDSAGFGWRYYVYDIKPGTTKKTYQNGVLITDAACTALANYTKGSNAYLGSDGATSGRLSFYGNIARFSIIQSASISVPDVEQYLALKYALPLPEGHAHKNYVYAYDDTGTTTKAATTSGNVLTNDVSASTGKFVIVVNSATANVGVSVAGSAGGVFTVAANGDWTFDPDGDFASLSGSDTATTSISYAMTLDNVYISTATLTVTVTA